MNRAPYILNRKLSKKVYIQNFVSVVQ